MPLENKAVCVSKLLREVIYQSSHARGPGYIVCQGGCSTHKPTETGVYMDTAFLIKLDIGEMC